MRVIPGDGSEQQTGKGKTRLVSVVCEAVDVITAPPVKAVFRGAMSLRCYKIKLRFITI